MPFKRGQSGNPKGRPKGIKDRRLAFRNHLESHAEALIQKARDMALEGDVGALRLCIERVLPPVKARDDAIELGSEAGTPAELGKEVLARMAAGELSPDQAGAALAAIAAHVRILEADELERRIAALEAKGDGK